VNLYAFCNNDPVNGVDGLGLTDRNAVLFYLSYLGIDGSTVTLDYEYRSATAYSIPYAKHEDVTIVLPPPPPEPYRPPELRAAIPRIVPERIPTLSADRSGIAFMANQATCGQYEFGSPIAESMATLPLEMLAAIMCPEIGYVYLAANLHTLADEEATVDAKTLAMAGVLLHRTPTKRLPTKLGHPRYMFDRSIYRYRDTLTGRMVAQRNLPYPKESFIWSRSTVVEPGTIIDRYGRPAGKYAAALGSTISERGMPLGSEILEYHRYKVVRPVKAEVGPASPVIDFNAEGYAMQYRFEKSIGKLVAEGFLEELF
jgi:hypothetical protein